jgi:hypothetical protein
MATIKVAFFKADKGEWDDKLIDLATGRLGFSHCELVVNRKTTYGAHFIDGKVIKCHYNDIFTDPRWVVIEKEIDKATKNAIIDWAKDEELGKEYDVMGVVCSTLIKRGLCVDPDETWCSKMVANCLALEETDVTPNELFVTLTDNGFRKISILESDKETKKEVEIDRLGRIKK